MKDRIEPEPGVDYERTVIVQGSYIRIAGMDPKKHAGGGRRGAQHGHSRRSERRFGMYLATCHKADKVIWLTYPEVRGPAGVSKDAKDFLRKLEKALKLKLGAVIKMETQERLSPELAILVWGLGDAPLDTRLVERTWDKIIKGVARVKVEAPRDWQRLLSYVAKQIVVTESEIVIGSKSIPFPLTTTLGSSLVKRAHNLEIPEETRAPFANPYLHSVETSRVKEEWLTYTGRYYWKHGEALIPKHPLKITYISGGQAASVRGMLNSTRKVHFVAEFDLMTLYGANALKAAKLLGLTSLTGTPVPADLESLPQPSFPCIPVPAQEACPSLPRDSVWKPHVTRGWAPAGRILEGRWSLRFPIPFQLPPFHEAEVYVTSFTGRLHKSLQTGREPHGAGRWLRDLAGQAAGDAQWADIDVGSQGCRERYLAIGCSN